MNLGHARGTTNKRGEARFLEETTVEASSACEDVLLLPNSELRWLIASTSSGECKVQHQSETRHTHAATNEDAGP